MPYDNFGAEFWRQYLMPQAYASEQSEPFSLMGEASYYTDASVDPRWGGVTKSGEKFDETKMTAAVLPRYWKLLKGKTLRVSSGDESVDVVVNDTGGFEKYGRIVDLSKAAFEKLAPLKQGIIKNVKVEIVEDK